MFENYGRGDLAQYLESKGYFIDKSDDLECLRVAAELDAQARAFAKSALVREVAANAQRIMQEALYGTVAENVRSAVYGDEDDPTEDDENIFLGW